MTSSVVNTSWTRHLRLPFLYKRLVIAGRIGGALRVLLGKNASVPKGTQNTRVGLLYIDDYYGGLKLGLPQGDLYWKADKYDGWGASPGQPIWPLGPSESP